MSQRTHTPGTRHASIHGAAVWCGAVLMATTLAAPVLAQSGTVGSRRGDIPNDPTRIITDQHDRDEYSRPPSGSPLWDRSPAFDRLDRAARPGETYNVAQELVPEYLVQQIVHYVSNNTLLKAEELAQTLVTLAPMRPAAHYNQACVLSHLGKIDEAIEALDRAVDLGFRRKPHLSVDPDLDALRTHERYARVMEKLDRLIAAETVEPMPLRTDDALETVTNDLAIEIPDLMERYQVPGVSVALVRDGAVVWTEAFGRIDERADTEMTERVVFRAGTATRLFMALMALRLEEQGAWSLDDPLAKWLPAPPASDSSLADTLTIRSALNYTAGLVKRHPADGLPPLIDEEIRSGFAFAAHRVGSMYTYVPESYVLVGRAIEKASEPADRTDPASVAELERPFVELSRGISVPLGMTDTLAIRPSTKRRRVASGHTDYGTPYRNDAHLPLRPDLPAFTTAADMGRLLAFLMAPEQDDRSLLSADAVARLYEPGLPLEDGSTGFGLGVQLRQTEHGLCVETSEVVDGIGSLIRWYPDAKCGVVVFFNSDEGLACAQRIAHRALGGE